MISNQSIPRATVIPVLAYPDVNQAAAWLCDAFGFSVRLRIGNHRVQLNVGDGAVIVREMRVNEVNAALGMGYSVTIRVEDADAHCNRARDHGNSMRALSSVARASCWSRSRCCTWRRALTTSTLATSPPRSC